MHPLDLSIDLLHRHDVNGSRAALQAFAEQNPRDLRPLFNLGWHLCYEGKWSEAAPLLDCGRHLGCYGAPPLKNGKPIWNEHVLEGKTLHLRCEGGFGDEMIAMRFVRDFVDLGARVVVSCSPGVASLFARTAGVAAVCGFDGADHLHCDYWMPGMSCARWFNPASPPYLIADPERIEKWRRRLAGDPRPKIALRWSGNPKFEREQLRRFPPELMISLAREFPHFAFYSFQRDENLVDLTDAGVFDLRDELTDWEDTAAAIACMDLVISSCTSVAHLAAAMGLPAWVIVPVLPYYCWAMPESRSVWYESVLIFRQKRIGDWRDPFKQVRRQLRLNYGLAASIARRR